MVIPPHENNKHTYSRPTHKNTRVSKNTSNYNNNTPYGTQQITSKSQAKNNTTKNYQHQVGITKIKPKIPWPTGLGQKIYASIPPYNKNKLIYIPSKTHIKKNQKHKPQHQSQTTHKSPNSLKKINKNTLLTKTTLPIHQTT